MADVEELLAGLNPLDPDTDGDSFLDPVELAAGEDPLDPTEFPPPDGDIFPLGAPDGIVDLRDLVLAVRLLDPNTPPPAPGSGQQATAFYRHADLAPTVGGAASPDGTYDAGDLLLIMQKATE